jgi:hypothetical protein
VIIVGHPGGPGHSLGKLPMIAAMHHKKEIENNKFPDLPHFDKTKHKIIGPVDAHTVTDFNKVFEDNSKINNVIYLAYFGHSWADIDDRLVTGSFIYHPWGVLYLGGASAPGTNMGTKRSKTYDDINTTPVSTGWTNIYKINPNAQIRLFGCRGGYDEETKISDSSGKLIICKPIPIAKQLAELLPSGVNIYAYGSDGGSFFTQDKDLGHGSKRAIKQAEIEATFPKIKEGDPLWMVAAGIPKGWAIFKGEN